MKMEPQSLFIGLISTLVLAATSDLRRLSEKEAKNRKTRKGNI
jgi:hypothetical protein